MLPGLRGMIRSGSTVPPAFKSASSYSGAAATSHSLTMPGTFAAGDLLIATVTQTSGAPTSVTSFTGWTALLSGTAGHFIYYKVAAGSDTATIQIATSRAVEASIAAYGSTTGVEGTPTSDEASGDITLSAITVTTSGGALVATSTTSNTVSTPSGFTQNNLTTPSTINFYWFSKTITSTGSTGTVLLDESASASHAGALIYIKP